MGTMLLWPTASEFSLTKTTDLNDEQELCDKLHSWMGAESAPLVRIVENMEAFVEEQRKDQSVDAFVNGVARLRCLGSEGVFNMAVKVKKIVEGIAKRMPTGPEASAPQLGPDTMATLDEARGLAKRVVKAYETLLKLGREKLGEDSEFDLFLLQLLDKWGPRELLINGLRLIRHIETISGALDQKFYKRRESKLQSMLFGPPGVKSARNAAPPVGETARKAEGGDGDEPDDENLLAMDKETLTEEGMDSDGSFFEAMEQ